MSATGRPTRNEQAEARQAWRRSGGTLTGAQLGELFGRSERWGRKQIAAARTEPDGHDATGAAPRTGTAAQQHARGPAPHGTTATRQRSDGWGRSGTGGRAGTAAARRDQSVPLALVVVAVAAVVLVTIVSAVVSYIHIRDLARLAGLGGLSNWLPLGLDGLVVACSSSLIVDHQRQRPGQPLAKLGLTLGLASSLAANVLAVDPDIVSVRSVRWVLAGYPPAALAVSGQLLFRMLADRHGAPESPPARTDTPAARRKSPQSASALPPSSRDGGAQDLEPVPPAAPHGTAGFAPRHNDTSDQPRRESPSA